VADTVTTALHVPEVEVANVRADEQLSMAEVAFRAAASASALVG